MTHVFNDMDLLMKLGRHKILDLLFSQCTIAVSAVRLTDYSQVVQKEIKSYCDISLQYVDENFPSWNRDKTKYLTLGDLSSIYLSMAPGNDLILSSEDICLPDIAKQSRVKCIQIDDFIIAMIKDQRTIQLYNLIKLTKVA